jgi:poly(A) polymerase
MDMEPLHRAVLETWEVPTFPVSGYDLIRAGMKPGPQYGVTLDKLRLKWADSGYTMSREELMKYVAN